MRLIFMGTPAFSVPALTALLASHHQVIAVYSQPPKPSGRGQKLTKSPVHELAECHGIPVFTPKTLRQEDSQRAFRALNADMAIVAAYGLILPKEILEAPLYGCVNIHGSLLPRWRGAAPIQRAIEAGDKETGITLMQMDEGLDTGDMLIKESITITTEMTSSMLHDALSHLGAKMLLPLLDTYPHWSPEQQTEDTVTYAHKLEKQESKLDFSLPAQSLEQKIRAFTPWPGTYFEWHHKLIKVLEATPHNNITTLNEGQILIHDHKFFIGCHQSALEINLLQLPGKKPMDALSFINGYSPCSAEFVTYE